jgi:hypothetical protein
MGKVTGGITREREKPTETMKPTGGLHPPEREKKKRFGISCWAVASIQC